MTDISIKTTSYDEVPYPSTAYAGTHPDRLATLAVMSGMTPPPVTRCSVLELACSDGGNLIPMAYALPESKFVGVDLSREEIASGRAKIAQFGLTNIELKHIDILDIGPEFGIFDYIIAYGVYSWAPPDVQDRILRICHDHLSPNGVAYVSYNTLPGWHLHKVMRDLLLYHTSKWDKPDERIAQARNLLQFISEFEPAETDLYGHLLKLLTQLLGPLSDSYVFHDFMEAVNEPVYFHEFIRRAKKHNLQFLANAESSRSASQKLSEQAAAAIFKLTDDVIEIEQYMDFLLNSTFRQTALVHDAVTLNRTVTTDCLTNLRISAQVRPADADIDLSSTEPAEFTSANGTTSLTLPHPLTKAALLYLATTWPHAVPFDELVTAAFAQLHPQAATDAAPSAADVQALKSNLLAANGHSPDLVELHTYSPRLTTEVTEQPIASLIARSQAQEQQFRVINMRHQFVDLDEANRQLLCKMDGDHDHAALLETLVVMEAEGALEVTIDEEPITDEAQLRSVLAEALQVRLTRLGQVGLLVG